MHAFIDEQKSSFGVEPICQALAVAPSTYYAAKVRPPSARSVTDAALAETIGRVHAEHFGVYGVRKVWRTLRRMGVEVGRDQVGRIMRGAQLRGATRTRSIRTTRPAPVGARPADLVERAFTAAAPNTPWVADLTYVWTVRGYAYTAFIVDVFARRIVGWREREPANRSCARRARDGDLEPRRRSCRTRSPQ